MLLDLKNKNQGEIYHLMTQTILPRPIAWILTKNPLGKYNLAPFSFFTGVSSDPPILMFSVGKKEGEKYKDTFHNIEDYPYMTIHIPSVEQLDVLNASAETIDRKDSEVEKLNIELVDFLEDSPFLPRLKDITIAYACKLHKVDEIGNMPQKIVYVEILSIYLADHVIDHDIKGRLKIESKKVNPLNRLGANEYSSLGKILTAKRP